MSKIFDYSMKYNNGFIALIAVVMLATGTLAFSLVVLSSVVDYSESVSRKELRIQATMNARACLDMTTLMAVKDYFTDTYGKGSI